MGTILTFSGVSASGKTTIAREILAVRPNAKMVTSITTRPPRSSDIPGEYRQVPKEVFDKLCAEEFFLWDVEHAGTHYGTPWESIVRAAERCDGIGIMILTPDVMPTLSKFLLSLPFPSIHVPVFLNTPPREVLIRRIVERGDSIPSMRERWEQSSGWEDDARASLFPFHFIDNNRPITETVSEVLKLL
jgi:guanylate kinase